MRLTEANRELLHSSPAMGRISSQDMAASHDDYFSIMTDDSSAGPGLSILQFQTFSKFRSVRYRQVRRKVGSHIFSCSRERLPNVKRQHHAPCCYGLASIAASARPETAPSAPVHTVNTASATASAQAVVPLKPASDVVAGAVARAASQSTIHPIDTLKVRLQTSGVNNVVSGGLRSVTSLYNGVAGAAAGAGIALGAYFACYGIACNTLSQTTNLSPSAIAFVGGGLAAAGSSVVKVPIAVCIRSVQAGVYPNAFQAARSILSAAGPRGLFTGYTPTLLEDVPDMAFKFAAYETLKQCHRALVGGRNPSMPEDFCLGATAGAFAAAATTPLDVVKTNMMCTAAGRPSMRSAAAEVMREGGFKAFFRGIGPRAASNGVNSAVFFAFFEALRKAIKEREAERLARAEDLACIERSAPSGRA